MESLYYVLVFDPQTRAIASIEPYEIEALAEARRAAFRGSSTQDARVAILGRLADDPPFDLPNQSEFASTVLAILLRRESEFQPHDDPPLAA